MAESVDITVKQFETSSRGHSENDIAVEGEAEVVCSAVVFCETMSLCPSQEDGGSSQHCCDTV